jgi:hypothetical protein
MSKPDVPHAKVVEIAETCRQLMKLTDEKHITIATMIRACVQRIEAPAPQYRGRICTHRELTEAMRQWRDDKVAAVASLKQLAQQLEDNATKASGTLTLSNEGTESCSSE